MTWIILSIVLTLIVLAITIVAVVNQLKDVYIDLEEIGFACAWVFIGLLVMSMTMLPVAGRVGSETNLREYERYQEMVEHVYKSEDESLSYAMNIKVTEMNEKLANWQNRQERWGYWFSLIPPRVQDLEYIKLERSN